MIIFLGNSHSLSLYEDLIKESKNDSPDIVVSCQYPHKIPEILINSHTCVNIHYGTLPFYAGCNPIYWQVLKDTQAGVTIHYMDKNLDSGDIINLFQIPIGGMTADEVYDSLAIIGLRQFKKFYPKILNNTAPRKKQDLSHRTYYPKNMVDFNKEKYCKLHEIKKIRAIHFKGKQYPVVTIGGHDYEVRRS
jgi:methionyl-tRNA formyltransferase